jgi:hypothetical protein
VPSVYARGHLVNPANDRVLESLGASNACGDAFRPAQCLEPIEHSIEADRIGCDFHRAHQHCDPTRPTGLLRAFVMNSRRLASNMAPPACRRSWG